jgi:hypothetical protein
MSESRLSEESFDDQPAENEPDFPTSFLPPGTQSVDLPVAGLLNLSIGKLLDLKSTANFDNIKIKPVFWGESEAPFLLRATNTCLSESDIVSRAGRYLVK